MNHDLKSPPSIRNLDMFCRLCPRKPQKEDTAKLDEVALALDSVEEVVAVRVKITLTDLSNVALGVREGRHRVIVKPFQVSEKILLRFCVPRNVFG